MIHLKKQFLLLFFVIGYFVFYHQTLLAQDPSFNIEDEITQIEEDIADEEELQEEDAIEEDGELQTDEDVTEEEELQVGMGEDVTEEDEELQTDTDEDATEEDEAFQADADEDIIEEDEELQTDEDVTEDEEELQVDVDEGVTEEDEEIQADVDEDTIEEDEELQTDVDEDVTESDVLDEIVEEQAISEEGNIGQELFELTGETEEEEDTGGVLSDAAVEAEDVGLSSSFIKLPFEESREERRARLQQDAYFDELVHISQTGVHQYKVEMSPIRGSASLNVGVFPNPSFINNNRSYEDIYGSNPVLMLFANYEWNLLKNIGYLSINVELGTLWDSGNGRFVNDQGVQAKERYIFLMLPVSLGVMYSLEYWNKQIFIPFGIGGISYFGLLEIRDDFDFGSIGIAGTPSLFFGGGLQFLLDSLSAKGLTVIDKEFGINHIYLIGEVRQYISLSGNFQLEGLVASGGVRFDF